MAEKPKAESEPKAVSVRELAEKSQQIFEDKHTKKTTDGKKTDKIVQEEAPKKERRFHFFPKFLRNAFIEIKLVTWPDRITTIRLTVAVIIFSIIFAIFVGLLDWVFEIIFKKVFLHG